MGDNPNLDTIKTRCHLIFRCTSRSHELEMSEDQAGSCNGRCGSSTYVGKGRYTCAHDNLLVSHPEVCLEWDPERNKITPDKYSSGSSEYAWWVCRENHCGCHVWQAKIKDRVRVGKSTGCPFCSGKPCPHNNLLALYPELCLEWDTERNVKSPSEYAPKSHAMISWKCSKASCVCHLWQTKIYDRVGGTGCPFCSRTKLCPHNNLLALYPDLCLEWSQENENTPDKYAPNSNVCVWWVCRKSLCRCHVWRAKIANRTRGGGCPFCYSGKSCPHNNLLVVHPDLCLEWNRERNVTVPETYAPYSRAEVWWTCTKGHEWLALIGQRALGKSGCRHCARTRKYSKGQIKWLESVMKEQNIIIQYALSPEGEYRIPTIGKVDGFCHQNNTAFEYHGNFWHGNPSIFKGDDMNTITHKTFGQLYRDTMARDDKIRKLGYNLVVQWETDLE